MSLFQAWWITKSPRYIRMSQLVPQCLGCCRTLCSRCFLVAPRGICLRPAFVERKSHRGEALWHRRRWTGRQMNFRKSAEILWGLMMFCRDCINPKKCDPVLFLESLNIDFDCVSNVSVRKRESFLTCWILPLPPQLRGSSWAESRVQIIPEDGEFDDGNTQLADDSL